MAIFEICSVVIFMTFFSKISASTVNTPTVSNIIYANFSLTYLARVETGRLLLYYKFTIVFFRRSLYLPYKPLNNIWWNPNRFVMIYIIQLQRNSIT